MSTFKLGKSSYRTKPSMARNIVLCLSLAAGMSLSTGFTQNNLQSVIISVDGKTIETKTTHQAPDIILARAGVKMDAKDEYTLRKIDDHTEITVHRAVPVTISLDGQTKTIMTSKPTVGDVLVELGTNLDDVEVEPGLDTKIQENLDIKVTDVSKQRAEEAAQRAEAERQPQVQTSRGAQRYSNALTMEATAYIPSDGNGDGITATGMVARHGVVAVDPNVIPLGSHLYIPGYGEAIAADTGGAIYGDRIDLCMDSYGEAMNFGRRYVTVYVLN